MGEFVAEEEAIESYVMCLKHYFKAVAVKVDKKVLVLITVLGAKNLATLPDLLAPSDSVADEISGHGATYILHPNIFYLPSKPRFSGKL